MKISRVISAILALLLAFSVCGSIGGGVLADDAVSLDTSKDDEWTPPLSIADPLPEENLFYKSDFNGTNMDRLLENWDLQDQGMIYHEDENGGYLHFTDIMYSYRGFKYKPSFKVEKGLYKFTGYFRTANEGEKSKLNVHFYMSNGVSASGTHIVNITNEWIKAELYFRIVDTLDYVFIRHSTHGDYIQEYCVDNFSLEAVDKMPPGASLPVGEDVSPEEALYSMLDVPVIKWDPENEKQYDVGGIIINHDNTDFLLKITENNYKQKDIIDYARQFEGTHVTDYFINVRNIGSVNYPSDEIYDYLDGYYSKEQNGIPVDFTKDPCALAVYKQAEVLGIDYIDIWHDTFREIGINPWLSYRMNDVHNMNEAETDLAWGPFYHGLTDEQRRAFYKKEFLLGYYAYAPNYTSDYVRDMMLKTINDGLNHYDTYGIELDFQRNVWLFEPGGEYRGIELLNTFMRELDDMIKLYEKKYGHEIKLAVRVASDIQTNMDFGFDIITWAAEDIIDLVICTSFWATTDNDLPIKMWDSMLTPYGVELAAGVDMMNLKVHPKADSGGHDFHTMSAFAANVFSQGADKVYLFNYFKVGKTFDEDMRVNINSTVFPVMGDERGGWNMLTTIGSLDKLMTVNRRSIVTYNDIKQSWKDYNAVFPQEVKSDKNATIRIPVGKVAEGSVLTLKFSTDNELIFNNPPTVYVNSEKCEFAGREACIGIYTKNPLLCYTIPESVHDMTYMIAEIETSVDFVTDYAEVYIDVSK